MDRLIASEDISIQDIEVVDKLLSDHFVMSFSFNLRKPARATRDVSSRDIRRVSLNAFNADVGALQLDGSDLLHSYNSGLREALDKHAPLRHRRITDRPAAPWLAAQIKEAKQQRICAERRWRKSGLNQPPPREGEETPPASKEELRVQQDREQFFLQRSLPRHRSVVGQEEGQHPPKLHLTVDLQIRLEISSRLRSRD